MIEELNSLNRLIELLSRLRAHTDKIYSIELQYDGSGEVNMREIAHSGAVVAEENLIFSCPEEALGIIYGTLARND